MLSADVLRKGRNAKVLEKSLLISTPASAAAAIFLAATDCVAFSSTSWNGMASSDEAANASGTLGAALFIKTEPRPKLMTRPAPYIFPHNELMDTDGVLSYFNPQASFHTFGIMFSVLLSNTAARTSVPGSDFTSYTHSSPGADLSVNETNSRGITSSGSGRLYTWLKLQSSPFLK